MNTLGFYKKKSEMYSLGKSALSKPVIDFIKYFTVKRKTDDLKKQQIIVFMKCCLINVYIFTFISVADLAKFKSGPSDQNN